MGGWGMSSDRFGKSYYCFGSGVLANSPSGQGSVRVLFTIMFLAPSSVLII